MNDENDDESLNPILDAIEAAEEIQDPFGALIEQAKKDPGAPFSEEALRNLIALKQRDRASFESLWAMFKSETSVRTGELEKAMQRSERENCVPRSGRALTFPEIEPWPDPVDGEALLEEIVAAVRHYVMMELHAPEAIALWIMHAHAHNMAQISPRLSITSPEKRCGKTTLLSVVQQLVPKPLPASNITPAALFRSVELIKPTILIDEADTFLKNSDELRGILNSGHNRAGASVIRTVGENHEPTQFNTWAPVAIAMIGRLPETLADRSIEIRMRRRRPDETVERLRIDRVEHLVELARKAARWVEDNEITLRARDDDAPACLNDRAADNWRPLMAIAQLVGGEWPRKAEQAAIALSVRDEDSDSVRTMLLADIRELYSKEGTGRLTTQQILLYLNDKDDRPWPEWKGKPITARQLARLLEPFKITSGTIRPAEGETAKGYYLKDFEDVFARYLPGSSVTTSQVKETNGLGTLEAVTKNESVTDVDRSETAEISRCDGVTDQEGEIGQQGQEPAQDPSHDQRSKRRVVTL